MSKSEKIKAINSAVNGLKKKMDISTFVNLNEDSKIERFKLSSLALNYLLGGGLPKGRIIELYGQESNGKGLLAFSFVRDIQNLNDGFVFWLDFEYAFDKEFAERNGVDLSEEKFLLVQPDNLEEGMETIEALAKTKSVALGIWDSTNASKSFAESQKEYTDALMGVNARQFSSGLRRITALLSKNNMSMCFISQMRDTMSLYGGPAIGVGNAMKFYASIRVGVRKKEVLLDDNKEVNGLLMILKTKKNKTASPNREVEIVYTFDEHIDPEKEIIDYALKYEILEKGGAWITMSNGERIQGKEKAVAYLKDNPEIAKELKEKVEVILFNKIAEKKEKEIDPENIEE